MLAPTPCATLGCNNRAVAQGVCQDHKRVWVGSTRKARLPRDWNTRRLIVMKRDQSRCYLCGAIATDVDHVVAGDDHSLTNLKAICPDCHKSKSSREGHEAKAANRIRRR